MNNFLILSLDQWKRNVEITKTIETDGTESLGGDTVTRPDQGPASPGPGHGV